MFAKNANTYYVTSNTVELFLVKYFALSVSTFVIIIDFIIYYLLQITCVLIGSNYRYESTSLPPFAVM